ncbi:MAG: hypothetical protein ACRDPB_05245, partial [Nocardioidaceae bacterium]
HWLHRRPGARRTAGLGRFVMRLGGHLGSAVSALVDGQLDHDNAERAWAHVLGCTQCRRLVEREGWVKTQVVAMSYQPTAEPPTERLLGSLLHLEPSVEGLQAWSAVDDLEARHRTRRRAGLALAGAGSVSAAVFGLSALGGSTLGIGGAGATPSPASSLTGRSATPSQVRFDVSVPTTVHGRVRDWRASEASSNAPGAAQSVAVADPR